MNANTLWLEEYKDKKLQEYLMDIFSSIEKDIPLKDVNMVKGKNENGEEIRYMCGSVTKPKNDNTIAVIVFTNEPDNPTPYKTIDLKKEEVDLFSCLYEFKYESITDKYGMRYIQASQGREVATGKIFIQWDK